MQLENVTKSTKNQISVRLIIVQFNDGPEMTKMDTIGIVSAPFS